MEIMDFESDDEQCFGFSSRPHTPHPSAKGRGNQSDLSDMDVDPISPAAKSSTSFDQISQALNSMLSLNNVNDDSDNDTRHKCAPRSASTPYPSVQRGVEKTWKPAAVAVLGTVCFKNAKEGSAETRNDQLPEIISSNSLRQRSHIDKRASKEKQFSLNASPVDISKNRGNHSHSKIEDSGSQENGYKRQSSCGVFVTSLILLMLFLAAMYLGMLYANNNTEKCKISKHFNKQVLKIELETNVFGQHLATKTVPDKIEEYFSKFDDRKLSNDVPVKPSENEQMCKPLVLSFDGWTGVGKNYISKFISEAFQYSTVMNYVVPYNFPHQSFEDMYRLQIQEWILGNFSRCRVNIVVVDEVDKAFPTVIEGLRESMKELTQPCSSTSPTIFLLLSNTHGSDINRIFVQFLLDSPTRKREEISLEHFSSIFTSEIKDWTSKLTDTQLIDAFVPFLPLEKEHVIQCIKKDLVSKRFSTDMVTVNRVLEELSFSSFGDIKISQTGCKRVADKVDLVMFEK